MAIVALRGSCCSSRKTVALSKRVVLVHGRCISEEHLSCLEPDQDERRGVRFGLREDCVAGRSSPRRHWPHHAETAIARAQSWQGEPSVHALASIEIMDDLIGGLCVGFLVSRGQNSVSDFITRLMHSGCLHGRRCLMCHERIAERLFLAVPGPVQPRPSQTKRRSSSSEAGSASDPEKPIEAANLRNLLIV